MKKIFIIIIASFLLKSSFAQRNPFTEGKPVEIDGVEFIYKTVFKELQKNPGGTDYSIYTLSWNISNKGKFSKIFLLRARSVTKNDNLDMASKAFLGKIYIDNAIDLSNTKSSDIISRDPNIQLGSPEKSSIFKRKKYELEGFNLQPGEAVSSSILVAVAKDTIPVVSLHAIISDTF